MKPSEIKLVCLPPDRLDESRLDMLAAFIRRHGRVPPGRVRANLEKAYRIAWAEVAGRLAGVSCLKRPRPAYLQDLGARLGFVLDGFLERGYTCVSPDRQGAGIATALTTRLTEEAGDRPFYVLAAETNPSINSILLAGGMVRIKAFDSEKAGRRLAFWVSPPGARRLGLS
ncbi:hypothetical protein EDC39_11656 [Geothermobacter ehrlichii]|uniref:Acetyltransferase (GNAT) family protein n=1 Tax=Geothermobacter ehrlichii TaxID=213224 RepID=A0A5D3WH89_9BACT|nr:hypothetical protein [Geothermobacter ehrlichii]TYO95849.1 hypothetical protein EDC39_11656 [Geothermobacter ehrlichii]